MNPSIPHVKQFDMPVSSLEQFPSMGHLRGVARAPTDSPDIKVRVLPHEKALFVKACELARQSLTQWMTQAGIERAAKQGLRLPKRGAK